MNLNKISRRNFLCAAGLTTAAALTACGGAFLCRCFFRGCPERGAHRLCRRLPH